MWVTARGWGDVYVSNTNMAVGKDRSCARRNGSNPSRDNQYRVKRPERETDLCGLYGCGTQKDEVMMGVHKEGLRNL